MFTTVLTHYQAMPSFLDFVFPFGHQLYAEDFYFSGFREDTRMSLSDGGLQIPELGRSGRDVRLCYNLKSVESIENQGQRRDLPWSVRQTALYHSFDIDTGKASWVVIKGNHLVRDRIKSATTPHAGNESRYKFFETTAGAFISTLTTHLVLCEWSVEDWRWYITSLEKKLQELTRKTLAVDIPRGPISPDASSPTERMQTPVRTFSQQISQRAFSFGHRVTGLSMNSQLETLPESRSKPAMSGRPMLPPILPPGKGAPFQSDSSEPRIKPSMSGRPMLPPVLPPGKGGPLQSESPDLDEVVSLSILQRVQNVEDRATEVLLSLTTNIKVVDNIMEHYDGIIPMIEEKCPGEFKERFAVEKTRFKKRIAGVLRDLDMARLSSETLLSLVQRRKELVSRFPYISRICS